MMSQPPPVFGGWLPFGYRDCVTLAGGRDPSGSSDPVISHFLRFMGAGHLLLTTTGARVGFMNRA